MGRKTNVMKTDWKKKWELIYFYIETDWRENNTCLHLPSTYLPPFPRPRTNGQKHVSGTLGRIYGLNAARQT